MTPRSRTATIAVLFALSGGSAALAQASATTSAGSTGTIFQPIAVVKDSDLSFGTVVRPLSGSGTVTIDATNGARTTGGSVAVIGSGLAAGRAAFSVAGEGGQTFSIGVPANVVMTRSGGSETITATLTPTATSGTLTNSLGTAGAASFGVGGEIGVASTTATGSYDGAFTVTVAYN